MGLQCNDEMQEDVMSETDIIEAKEQVSSVIFEHQEQEIPHNPYDQELREMDSIRRGDVEMLKHSMSGNWTAGQKSSPAGEECCYLCYHPCFPCCYRWWNGSGRGIFYGGWIYFKD